MQFRSLLALPVVTLLACTSAGRGDAVPTHQSTAAGAATPNATTTFASWPTYHGNVERSGFAATMPTASGVPRIVKTYTLDGRVYASPIVVRGLAVAATENDTVYGLRSGSIVWKRHLGTPAPQSQLPCGNIFPLGITGTPAYYKGRVFVTAEFGSSPRHVLYALRVSDGSVLWHRNVDLSGVQTAAMQQRGALLVAGGRVWVPFGGLAGDCGAYKGRLVGVPYTGSGSSISYTVPTTREAGMWTPPGPSFGGGYLFAAVGNGSAGTGAAYDHSDSILKITTSAHLAQSFSPTTWQADNDADLDLGSQGPALVGNWVFADGKRGMAYVLSRANLGGIGGQVSSMPLCTSFGGPAVVGTRVFVPCTDGVRAVRVDATGHMTVLWHASSSITGSPIVGGARVWSLDPGAGVLHALDVGTGASVASVSVGSVTRFATPAAYGRDLYVPTTTGVQVVATS